MYVVHSSIQDTSTPYLVVFCKDRAEAVHNAALMLVDNPDLSHGVWTDRLGLIECLALIGFNTRAAQFDAIAYLQFLLPYCAPEMAGALLKTLVNICNYRIGAQSPIFNQPA